jgi:hypothetical protein
MQGFDPCDPGSNPGGAIMRNKKDFRVIVILIILAALAVFHLKLEYLPTVILFFGIPSLYISIRNKKIIKKPLEFAVLISLPAVFVFDYLAHINNVWYESSTIGIRILNTFPIDTFIWSILYIYFIIMFYEHFFDNTRTNLKFSKKIKFLIYHLAILLFVFSIILKLSPGLLEINYLYIKLIICLFLIPITVILGKYPKLIKKISIQGAIFLVISIIYELLAVYLSQWQFNGTQYIGWIVLLGQRFPFEEFLWLIFAVPAFICLYEYFADDLKN